MTADGGTAAAMGREGQETAPLDTALATFVLMLGFLQRSADSMQLRHAAGKGSKPLGTRDLLRLAKKLDVRARDVFVRVGRLQRQPLPAIAQDKDGRYFLLLQVSAENALIFHPEAERPQTVTLKELGTSYAGRLILMTTRERIAGGVPHI